MKGKISRATGVPLTRSGRQRKMGKAMGYLVMFWALGISIVSAGVMIAVFV